MDLAAGLGQDQAADRVDQLRTDFENYISTIQPYYYIFSNNYNTAVQPSKWIF